MNSKKNLAKLGRKKSHADALKRNLLTSLVLYEHVKTTRIRAKAIVPLFDKLIKEANKEKHLAERNVTQMLFDENAVRKVMEVLKPRFGDESRGLVQMFKVGNRKGDNAEMVQLFVKGYEYKDIGTKTKKTKKEEPKQEKKQESGDDSIAAKSMKDTTKSSQIKGAGPQGKAKSRSGI